MLVEAGGEKRLERAVAHGEFAAQRDSDPARTSSGNFFPQAVDLRTTEALTFSRATNDSSTRNRS
jgi:hypothetical protein